MRSVAVASGPAHIWQDMTGSEKKGEACEVKPGEKKPLKPCCACPETKKKRDEWFV